MVLVTVFSFVFFFFLGRVFFSENPVIDRRKICLIMEMGNVPFSFVFGLLLSLDSPLSYRSAE